MLRRAESIGIQTIIATPHLHFYKQIGPVSSLAGKRLEELRNAIRENELAIQLESGFEVYLRPELSSFPEIEKLTLAQRGEYVLIELGMGQIPSFVEKACFDLILNGFTPILAHPERNLISSSQLAIIERLVHQGIRLQIEASSLVGQNGPELKKACLLLLQKNLVTYVASDAHNLKRDYSPMQEAYHLVKKQLGEEKARELFFENQQRILVSTGVQTSLKFQTEGN